MAQLINVNLWYQKSKDFRVSWLQTAKRLFDEIIDWYFAFIWIQILSVRRGNQNIAISAVSLYLPHLMFKSKNRKLLKFSTEFIDWQK